MALTAAKADSGAGIAGDEEEAGKVGVSDTKLQSSVTIEAAIVSRRCQRSTDVA